MTTMAGTDKRTAPTGWLDRLGIGISAFCLLQCLALPLALTVLPVAGVGLVSHEAFHVVLLALIAPVSVLAFGLGFLRHRNARMWVPAGAGLALLTVAVLLEHSHAVGPLWIAAITSAGGIALITGHVLNLRGGSVVGGR